MPVGNMCSDIENELGSEQECQRAAANLGLSFAYSWDGTGDFPSCFYTDDGRNGVYFNLSPIPDRYSANPHYSAICLCTAGKNATLYSNI